MLRWNGGGIQDLTRPKEVTSSMQQAELELLRSYNQEYLQRHFTNPDLQGRIDAYELAYRMQAEVPGALDLAKESAATREMYGLGDETTESFAKRSLMPRQLVYNDVRFSHLSTPSHP